MARSFEDDVRDVAAVQEGDSQAFARLVEEYHPNLVKVAKQYRDSISFEQAFDLIMSSFGEWLMTATAKDAQYLRNNIARVAQRAVNGYLNGGGDDSKRSSLMRRAQLAMRAMAPRVGDPNEPAKRMTLDEACEVFEINKQTLLTHIGLFGADPVPFEHAMGEALDPDAEEFSAFDDQVVEPHLDPEFMDEVTVFDLDVRQSTNTHEQPVRAGGLTLVLDRLTASQRAVAELLMTGLSMPEVARELDMSRQLVRVHVRNMRSKFEAAGFGDFAPVHDLDEAPVAS